MADVFHVYVDGGARGRIAWVVSSSLKKIENMTEIPELKTGNQAEFYAVLRALFDLPGSSIVEIHSDSQLVVNGMKGEWNIQNLPLREIVQKINGIINKKRLYVNFSWIKREDNPAGKLIAREVNKEKWRRRWENERR